MKRMTPISTTITLKNLPAPPLGKTGWPWTEVNQSTLPIMPDCKPYPQISIVTPSYNQGEFIEETIRSVLLQNYPNLEYIIIDGGSTDDTVEIIKKYEQYLTYWVSEPDEGQTDAINKGFRLSKGDIMGWLNSDDLLEKKAFYHLAAAYKPGLNWWTGNGAQIFSDEKYINRKTKKSTSVSINDLLHARRIICQVATFWNRELWNKTGSSLKSFNLAMDYELWLRFSKISSSIPINQNLGILRTHSEAKTGTTDGMIAYLAECDDIRRQKYYKKKQNFLLRAILINFWTRFYLAKTYNWRSWLGRRVIPYV